MLVRSSDGAAAAAAGASSDACSCEEPLCGLGFRVEGLGFRVEGLGHVWRSRGEGSYSSGNNHTAGEPGLKVYVKGQRLLVKGPSRIPVLS